MQINLILFTPLNLRLIIDSRVHFLVYLLLLKLMALMIYVILRYSHFIGLKNTIKLVNHAHNFLI